MEFTLGEAKRGLQLPDWVRKVSYTTATIRKNRYFLRLDWI
ncbi:MAG: hypothetical protein P8L78_18400 [Mariniblastus sp.]|nr:hypothetical protein [Mariniblastus sp.]MDG2183667.1 hypothetical protein [Mariniblastus sp.]